MPPLLLQLQLHNAYESRGLDGLYTEDRTGTEQLILRARRIDRFLTQPFHGTEIWSGVPGVTVSLDDTLKGCAEILAGKYDELPEDAFLYIGNAAQAIEKAKEFDCTVH